MIQSQHTRKAKTNPSFAPWAGPWALGLLGVTVGVTAVLLWRRASSVPADPTRQALPANEPPSASPIVLKDHHAVSAVTGGLPEDMNYMPPTADFEKEGPIYDGHDIPAPRSAKG